MTDVRVETRPAHPDDWPRRWQLPPDMGVRDEEQPSRERYLRLAEDPYRFTGTRLRLRLEQSGSLAWLSKLIYLRLSRRYVEAEARGLKQCCESGET